MKRERLRCCEAGARDERFVVASHHQPLVEPNDPIWKFSFYTKNKYYEFTGINTHFRANKDCYLVVSCGDIFRPVQSKPRRQGFVYE
jgi:hypothetical protein